MKISGIGGVIERIGIISLEYLDDVKYNQLRFLSCSSIFELSGKESSIAPFVKYCKNGLKGGPKNDFMIYLHHLIISC